MNETNGEARKRLAGELLIADSKLDSVQAEIDTYHKRDNKESTAWFTIERIERVLGVQSSPTTARNEK